MKDFLFHGDLVSSKRILYTPSNFAKTSLAYLQEIGQLHAQQPHISKRDYLDSFLFFIVVSGRGTLTYHERQIPLSSGDCVFIDCRNPYSHETSDQLWKLKWIHFYGPNITNIYQKYIERGGQACFHPSDLNSFEELWDNLYSVSSSSDYIRDMRINQDLNCLLTLLMQESWHPETQRSGTKKQSLVKIKKYLDEHYSQKISLDLLSEQFFINKFYLTRVFKEQFGISVNNYLLQVRITHAKQLLRFTDQTIEEVGLSCGIGPLYYFSRVFKKIEGLSPNEYRKRW